MKMRKVTSILVIGLCLVMCFAPAAFAGELQSADVNTELSNQEKVCYPTAVARSDDGTELKKMYDLSPEDDPAGIPRSDFEQDGYKYTLVELLKQELPEKEERIQTETVTVQTKNKDMASVLAVLPEEKEFITDDGLMGTLKLQLETVNVDVAGYAKTEKELTASRTYPGLADQDISGIPKTLEDSGIEMSLQDINWQSDADGHFTAIANYSGSKESSYVKGYNVTADYTGKVSRIALNRIRYVAIYEGKPVTTIADVSKPKVSLKFNWAMVLAPIGIIAVSGAAIWICLAIKRRKESEDDDE